MGKKSTWFSSLKWLCIPKYDSEDSPITESPRKALYEAEDEQRKSTYAVAIATAAAMEAAVAANNTAAEIFRLIHLPCENPDHLSAAIKIQSLYRGYLGRKALSALKGVVKLQAFIRGELFRRAISKTPIFSSFSLNSKQPKLKSTSLHHNLDRNGRIKIEEEHKKSKHFRLQKQESNAKKEIMKRHSYSLKEQRNEPSIRESIPHEKIRRSLFDQCEVESFQQQKEKEKHRRLSHSNSLSFDESRLAKLKLKTAGMHDYALCLNSPISPARRSYSYSPKSNQEYEYSPNSFSTPMYMAPTESAKAKTKTTLRLKLCEKTIIHM